MSSSALNVPGSSHVHREIKPFAGHRYDNICHFPGVDDKYFNSRCKYESCKFKTPQLL